MSLILLLIVLITILITLYFYKKLPKVLIIHAKGNFIKSGNALEDIESARKLIMNPSENIQPNRYGPKSVVFAITGILQIVLFSIGFFSSIRGVLFLPIVIVMAIVLFTVIILIVINLKFKDGR